MIEASFVAQSREYLTEHYLPKIRAAVAALPSESELWWRPNEASNSIGNLLLHLSGNIRQWLVAGVGGAADQRDRDREFAERESLSRAELLERFGDAVLAADTVLARLSPDQLGEQCSIQGREVSVLEAVYHVVEHLAMHAGQIFYIVKLRTGKDLGFYRMEAGIVRPNWPGHPTSGSA